MNQIVKFILYSSLFIIFLTLLSFYLIWLGYPEYGVPLFVFLQIIHPLPP
jgi:hypothetical protein